MPDCLSERRDLPDRASPSGTQHDGEDDGSLVPQVLAVFLTVFMITVRRAELVFKCLKGFMMEMGGWGGSEIKTLQFLLPADIDQDVFLKLTAMLSTIFRVSSVIRG